MPVAAAIAAAWGLVTLALVLLGTAAAIRGGSLPRNGAVGIRTRATRHCDACWAAGHAAASPGLWHAGIAAGAAAACFVPVAVIAPAAVALAVLGAAYALVMGLLIRTAVVAGRATGHS